MAIFQKVEAKTLRPLIAGDIRDAIFDGRLQPGERLVERKLAEQFGASLTVIREALVELEIEGYIVKRQNKASHVIRVTLAEANRVFEMRRLLEPWAAAEAARHAKPDDVVQLRARFWEMRKRAAAKDITGYLRADRLFHEQIWRMSGNEYVAAALSRSLLPLTAYFSMRCKHAPFDLAEDAEGHVPILEAIAANDPAAAEQALAAGVSLWRTRPSLYAEDDGTRE